MVLFRYVKHWSYGLYFGVGMYSGHMLVWICSAIMVAAIGREMDPGRRAYQALGVSGAFAVFCRWLDHREPDALSGGLALQAGIAMLRPWPPPIDAARIGLFECERSRVGRSSERTRAKHFFLCGELGGPVEECGTV